MTVLVLDNYYLTITLLITIAYQLFFFAIAFSLKFDKLTDFAGGTNFVVLAIITLSFSGVHDARVCLASHLISTKPMFAQKANIISEHSSFHIPHALGHPSFWLPPLPYPQNR